MKACAAIAWAPNPPPEFEAVELEGPKAGEILVRIVTTSLCHADRFTLPGMVDEWRSGRVDVDPDPYITHDMAHDQLNTAFDLLHRVEAIRSVIHYQPQRTMKGDLPGTIVGRDQKTPESA